MRQRKIEEPKSPFNWNQEVKIRTKAGLETTGKISFVAYCPFPGFWCFEVTTDDGQVYKTTGARDPSQAIVQLERIEAPRIEATEAGPQAVLPETPEREISTTALRPKAKQSEAPLALEMIEAKQTKLF